MCKVNFFIMGYDFKGMVPTFTDQIVVHSSPSLVSVLPVIQEVKEEEVTAARDLVQ